MATTCVRHIGELTTNDPSLGDETSQGRLRDAAMVVDETRVLWVGPDEHAPDADRVLDVRGAAVVPGFALCARTGAAASRTSRAAAAFRGAPLI